MAESIRCNIAVVPSEKVAARAVALSNELSQKGSEFTLKGNEFYPHVSIYWVRLSPDNITEAERRLKSIARSLSAFSVTSARYNYHRRYLGVHYRNTTELADLQEKVIAEISPFWDGEPSDSADRLKNMRGAKLETVKRYGWSGIGEFYDPHLTFARFSNEQKLAELQLPNPEDFSFTANSIGLFELDDNGTCVKELVKLNFGVKS